MDCFFVFKYALGLGLQPFPKELVLGYPWNSCQNLALGFGVALSPFTLFPGRRGLLSLGTIIGALPGLGPSNGVAILIPLAFSLGLDATAALVLMTSVYYGAMYGGPDLVDPAQYSR